MGCSSCSTGSNGLPGGCKNNGACGAYGCNKLEVFDWLAGMDLPLGQKAFDIIEVRFKNSRKAFYRNNSGLELYSGDVIAVEVSPGYDVGVVSLTGELVRIQMKRKEVKDNYEIKKVLRKATEEDIKKWQDGRQLEQNTMIRARTVSREIKIELKLSDVEYQGDKTKATFFYTADDRVDFRELIKRFADEFRVKIEMRQIGYRHEAGRLGGIGSCGRELCCSSWLTDFRAVSTSAARYQQLSLNPTKLAGQCGKLKCCLNYELDQYVEALKEFPSTHVKLQLPKGIAMHFKTDIFQKRLFYVYEGQFSEAPFALSPEAAKEIIERNKKGIIIEDIDQFTIEEVVVEETGFAQVVGQDSLTRFDKSKKSKSGSKGKPTRGKDRPSGNRPPQQKTEVGTEAPAGGAPPRENRPPRPQQGSNQGNQQRPPRPPQGEGEARPQRPPQQNGPREPRENKPGDPGNPNSDNKPRPNDNRNRNRPNDRRKPGNNSGGNKPNTPPPAPEAPKP